MNIGLIYIIILCIWNSILFFDNSTGINVLLFTIPLLIYLFYIFKINKLIYNKWGLLFFIPIIILSIHYLIFNNVFDELNIIAIPCLYGLMYIFTIRPTDNLIVIIDNMVKVFLMPLECCENIANYVIKRISNLFHVTDNSKRVIKSLIIVLPIVFVVLALLSSADLVFGKLFSWLFNIIDDISVPEITGRFVSMFFLFFYMSITIYYLVNKFRDTSKVTYKDIHIDEFTIKLLFTILNIIYIIFDIIQIRSLLLHRVSGGIVYSEYARQGFFQLMFITFINLTIILLSKKSKKNKYNTSMSLFMIALTLVIIFSSIYRMYMYESAYGYTVLRLGVYTILFSEIILLIPTIIYILKDKFNVLKYYMIICITIYSIINLIPVDYVIARRNVDRYYNKNKIDLPYLENYKYENVSILKELYKKTDDKVIRMELDDYFKILHDNREKNIFEYNVFKNDSYKRLK